MIWDDLGARIALAEFVSKGVLRVIRRNESVARHLLDLGWATQTKRRSEIALAPHAVADIHALLGRIWPGWQLELGFFGFGSTSLDSESLRAKKQQEFFKKRGLKLPTLVNRHTFSALLAGHAKREPDQQLLSDFPDAKLTVDGVVRVRPNRGLELSFQDKRTLPVQQWGDICGEFSLSERTLDLNPVPTGVLPKCILTIENLGAFLDVSLPDSVLLVHAPGWNVTNAIRFISLFPSDIPFIHFGDLDPAGFAIRSHIEGRLGRSVPLFIPQYWSEYLDVYGIDLEEEWPSLSISDSQDPLLSILVNRGIWLEQECVAVDPRFSSEFVGFLERLSVN